MKASGLFFLRMHASTATDDTGQLVVLLPVLERDPDNHRAILNTMLVTWKGELAQAFFAAHHDKMRAGCPLLLDINRLHGRDGEWRGVATSCALAPTAPSWQKHDAAVAIAAPAAA